MQRSHELPVTRAVAMGSQGLHPSCRIVDCSSVPRSHMQGKHRPMHLPRVLHMTRSHRESRLLSPDGLHPTSGRQGASR